MTPKPSRRFWEVRKLLPAVAVSTAPATTISTAPAKPTPTASLARRHRPSFVDHQRATHEIAAVAGFNRMIGRLIVVNFHKPKPASLTGEPIPHYVYSIHGDTSLSKEVLQILFGGRVGEVPHKQFHHWKHLALSEEEGVLTTADPL